jgi:hypothetical protein
VEIIRDIGILLWAAYDLWKHQVILLPALPRCQPG